MRRYLAKLFGVAPAAERVVDLDQLTRLVRRYTVEQQHVPKNLMDLVSLKYLEALPIAPPGQRFVLDRKRAEVRLE